MATIVYTLSCIASISCAYVLLRCYFRTRSRILFWSGICFLGLALNNVLLLVDKLMFPETDLYFLRMFPMFAGVISLIYGMIWDTV